MARPYRIVLTEAERARLRGLVGAGVAPAQNLTRARILLKADHSEGGPGWCDATVAGALAGNPSTVLRVRRQCVRAGLEATLARKRPDRVYARAIGRDPRGAPDCRGLWHPARGTDALDAAPPRR